MKTRYSGKSFKDSSTMKKSKLSPKEKRKLKRENKKDSRNLVNRVLFNPVRASQLLRIPRCVIIIVVVDGFDLTLVMST